MGPAVQFNSAVSLLGRFPALAGVDLEVAPGEVVLVEGPNGAGKTTLLRACAGLVRIVSGDAQVLGVDLRRNPRGVRPHVGLLGHHSALYDDLTVDDNLRFVAGSVRREGRSDEVDAALGRVGLGERLRRLPCDRLSAGQRRRVDLAGLLVRRASLWLLDEPHAGLDAAGRDVLDDLVRTSAKAGVTVLVASHELERARALADRTVTLVGGRVLAAAPGREPAVVA